MRRHRPFESCGGSFRSRRLRSGILRLRSPPTYAPTSRRATHAPPLPFTLPLTPHPCLRPRNRSIRPSTAPRWRLKFYTHTVTSTGAHETTRIQRVRYSTRFLQRAVCVLTAIRGTRPIGFRSRAVTLRAVSLDAVHPPSKFGPCGSGPHIAAAPRHSSSTSCDIQIY